jgi:cysteine-rich repeat protein
MELLTMPQFNTLHSPSFVLVCVSTLALLVGCPDPQPGQDDTTSDTSGIEPTETGGDGDGDGAPGDGDGDGDGDGGDGDGDGDGGEPLGECGDGVLDLDESCDDGNLESGDGCSFACSVEGLIIPCGAKLYACGDGMDNDGDGKLDTDDPECISPCDDDEASFRTGIPSEGGNCKSDCFFDGNNGSGTDSCAWDLRCDPENPGAQIGCEYDPEFAMTCELEMPPECIDSCTPVVPNGCDCFGCCEIAGAHYYLDSGLGCSLDNLDACETCTFFEGCNNPCEPNDCELCFGQELSELPPECTGIDCPGDLLECQSSLECPEGTFCQTGCCVPVSVP